MNPDADNLQPGESFDFDARSAEFDVEDLPPITDTFRELGPAERRVVQQLEQSFATLEEGLRHVLATVEQINETDFSEVIRDPAQAESVCAFSEVAAQLPMGLAPIGLAVLAARAEFCLNSEDDLSESS